MKKYIVNHNVFTEENDLSFYLLGYYMTDGCLEQTKNGYISRFIVSSLDKELLLKIKRLLCPRKKLEIVSDKRSHRLRLTDKKCIDWLQTWGCTARKSHSLSLKQNIPSQWIADFLRGCIDGDGCITTYNKKWKNKGNKLRSRKRLVVHLTSASVEFISQIKKMIPKEIDYNITTYNAGTTTMHRINFYDLQAQQLLKWIYYPHHKLSMKRKLICMKKVSTMKFGRRKRTNVECKKVWQLQSNGLRSQQIANQLGIPRSTVWKIMHRIT